MLSFEQLYVAYSPKIHRVRALALARDLRLL